MFANFASHDYFFAPAGAKTTNHAAHACQSGPVKLLAKAAQFFRSFSRQRYGYNTSANVPSFPCKYQGKFTRSSQ
jgi:hypothetical protein